jgi:hypothetical protein
MPLRLPHFIAACLAILTCLVGAAFAVASDDEPLALTPSTFDVIFDNVPVGNTSAPQTVTVSNGEHDKVKVGQSSIVGPHPGDFLLSTDTCSGQTLDAGETCQFAIRFKPNADGTRVAHLKVPHDGNGCTLWITLAGSGPAAVARLASCADDDDEQKPSTPTTPDQSSASSTSGASSFLGSPAAANSAIGLPASTTKSCKSRRSFHIRINPPRGVRFTKVTVRLNKKLISVKRGKHLSAAISLKGLPRGRFTLRVVATTASGRSLSRTRHYVTCVKNIG